MYVNVNFFLCINLNCDRSNIIDNICANIDCTICDSLFHSLYFLSIFFLVKLNFLVKFFICANSNCTSSDQALHPLSLLVVIAALAQITKDKR